MNPYQVPASNLEAAPSTECYRIRKHVFVPTGHDLPHRCVKCNEPAVLPIKQRKFHWHSSWYYLLILLNILIYAIVALIVRRRVKLSPGLCKQHAARRRLRIALFAVPGALLFLGGSGVAMVTGEVAPFGFALWGLLMLIFAVIASRIVWPAEISKTGTYLTGCGEPFLKSLRVDR